jgi:hypothetical protein
MRTFLASLAVGLALTSGASAYSQPCDNVPPKSAQQIPSVDFQVVDVPRADMAKDCAKMIAEGARLYGCTFEPGVVSDGWAVILDQSLSPAERACTLLYEKAHLPPNNWQDASLEAQIPNEAKLRTWLGLR